ncbi:MAG: hypothetical protein ACYDDO_07850 [Acidiferrobacterales bacterium]
MALANLTLKSAAFQNSVEAGLQDPKRPETRVMVDAKKETPHRFDGSRRVRTKKDKVAMSESCQIVTRGIKEGFASAQAADLFALVFKRTKEEVHP